MSIYLFKNPKTGKVVEVFQNMNEPHVYENNGIVHERLFTIPQASIDTQFDPYSSKDFIRNTSNKKGTLGDVWDRSKEASIKREERNGVDENREKTRASWHKARPGKLHPDVIKENQNKTVEI